ncbi:hypothetical protein BaRGS_00014624 [Batillaria attramentaria]|uniref:Fibronectin type-III domain-containing protein n=1 Tax=Batillaria attramentaria TaxID=370345 RepID=A0ABD0L4G8_9CAEN
MLLVVPSQFNLKEFWRRKVLPSPVILPCSHVLCRAPCAENLFDFNFIRCPVCRENCYISGGIGSLPRVIALESYHRQIFGQRGGKLYRTLLRVQKQSKRGQDDSDVIPLAPSASGAISPVGQDPEGKSSFTRITSSDLPVVLVSRRSDVTLLSRVQRCVCDLCGNQDHPVTHRTERIEDAVLHIKCQRRNMKEMEIRKERMRRSEMEEVVDVYEKVLSASQSLGRHATTLLETGTTPSILQACGAVRDDLELDMNTVTATCSGRIVDLRRQQAMLRDIHYLNPPDPPAIDVTRCARSVDTVALFLAPPRGTSDVIDTYHIHYCSEEQKALGIEETVTCRSGHNEHLTCLSPTAASLSHVALLENLHRATTHYFYAAASNRAGHSGNSEVVQCVTLSPRDSVVPVPVIMESMCKAIQPPSGSSHLALMTWHQTQSISHYLLYRPRDRKSLWRAGGAVREAGAPCVRTRGGHTVRVCRYGQQPARRVPALPETPAADRTRGAARVVSLPLHGHPAGLN